MKVRMLMLMLMLSVNLLAGNRIMSPRFKSLTSIVNGNWRERPVMALHSADRLVIGFDELSHNYHRLTCRLEHCEADWTTSEDIFESDWLEGFNDIPIEDYQNSINTTVLYTHYRLEIPNDRFRLKISGNYRLRVFDEDNDDEEVLQVEFYVVEPLVDIGLSATTNTDIDHNISHQQVGMTLKFNNLRVTDVEEQLHTVIMQNWRDDNARRDVSPQYRNAQGLEWAHSKELIFDAGNEYHKFEMLDVSHTTMGLERIEWDGQFYQAYPFTATVRRNYLTDVDADGAFCIRNSDRNEEDYTCDYIWVNYTLKSPYQGDIYLAGHWATDNKRETYLMQYDGAESLYYTRLLQKQGYYSYQFLTPQGTTPLSEGNFYQTENRYQALVYYRPQGARTWQLVGYKGIELR